MTTIAVIGITGSTDGIGRAAARVLLADGHRVLVHARELPGANAERLASTPRQRRSIADPVLQGAWLGISSRLAARTVT